MAKAVASIKVPIFAKFGGKEYEIGVVEMDCKVQPTGRIVAPTPRDFIAALRKAR